MRWPFERMGSLMLAAACLLSGASADEPYGVSQRPPMRAFLNGKLPPAAVLQTGNWAVVEAFPKLEFDDPTELVPEPRSNRLYVTCRQGKIFWFDNDTATQEKAEFLDLTDVTQGWDDCGLMALAFHPKFGQSDSPNRRYVYVWYHYSTSPVVGPKRPPVNTPGYNRLSRFTVPDGSHTADRSSEQVLINQFDHNLWHDGGSIFFGQDGFLYVSLGDEGDQYDSFGNSQTISRKMFSGMLRIDVDCNPARSHAIRRQPQQEEKLPEGFTENNYTAHYFIPNDNPFLDPEGSKLEEFWAVGLRNPHRVTQDPATGRIWAGDVGQDKWEEIDVLQRAGNYQWAYREGSHSAIYKGVEQQKPAEADYLGAEQPPLYEYGHGVVGKCVIGGYVYRGKQFAEELEGKYIFGDNVSGRIWSLAWDGTNPPTVELLGVLPGSGYSGISSFGVDQNNELYVCKMGRPSRIYRLAHADEAARSKQISFDAPERLSWMGAFADLPKLEPMDGCIPYDVNSPLWSDGALKRRWIALPQNEQIKFSPTGSWTFPDGTTFIKNFELIDDETTGHRRRLETRFLVRQRGGGVYGVTYKWRKNETEADLVAVPQTETIDIKTADGTREQRWYFPGPADCLACHNSNAGEVLGVNTRQLNRRLEYAASGVTDNELRTWNHLGLFNSTLDAAAIDQLPALVRVDDSRAPLEMRVRSYLDANCAHCHRPNGAAGYFDARFDVPLAQQGLLNGRVAKTMDISGACVVAPANVAESVLYQRVAVSGALQMPPLARNAVDHDALAALQQWIESLPKAPDR